jgi:hypothetical protein
LGVKNGAKNKVFDKASIEFSRNCLVNKFYRLEKPILSDLKIELMKEIKIDNYFTCISAFLPLSDIKEGLKFKSTFFGLWSVDDYLPQRESNMVLLVRLQIITLV